MPKFGLKFRMFAMLFKRYPYFFNLLIVLVLIEITRTLDWLAWYPPSPANTRILLLEQLFEFLSLFPFVILMIVSYKWAIKRRRMYLIVVLVLVFTIFGPTLLIYFSSGLETIFWYRANRPPDNNGYPGKIFARAHGSNSFSKYDLLSYPPSAPVRQTKR